MKAEELAQPHLLKQPFMSQENQLPIPLVNLV